MAHITLTGTLLTPAGKTAYRDQIRFTHKSTTGETVKSSVDLLTIIASGFYYVELEYGLVLIEYKSANDSQFKNLGVATVNGTNPSTSIPELLNGLAPVSSAELIQFQAILADAVAAKNESVIARDEAEAFAASIDLINDLSQAYIFDTVAAFKGSTIEFPDGKIIHLLDRAADFTKITGNAATLDHNVIFSSGVNQSIQLLIGSTNNVKQFGAVGDGSKDDSLVFISAIAAMANKTLVVSDGTFNFGDNRVDILSPIVIIFDDSATIQMDRSDRGVFNIVETRDVYLHGNGANINHVRTVAGANTVYIENSKNVVIDGFLFDASPKDCIYLGNSLANPGAQSEWITIKNCEFRNARRQGISGIHVRHLRIIDCEFHSITGDLPSAGVDLESNTFEEEVYDTIIKGCKFYNLTDQAGLIVATAQKVTVDNCDFSNSLGGITLASVGACTESKEITSFDNSTDQITIPAHGYKIGNRVDLTDIGGTLPVGLLAKSTYRVLDIIDVNTITLSTYYKTLPTSFTTNGTLPCQIRKFSSSKCSDISIANCKISNLTNNAIYVNVATNVRIYDVEVVGSSAPNATLLLNNMDKSKVEFVSILNSTDGEGIFISGIYTAVNNCIVEGTQDEGIRFYGGFGSSITNNTLLSCGVDSSQSMDLRYFKEGFIKDNTIKDNLNKGITAAINMRGIDATLNHISGNNLSESCLNDSNSLLSASILNHYSKDNILDSGLPYFTDKKASSGQLNDIDSEYNTFNKYEGKELFNSTGNHPVYATGGAAGSAWVSGSGTVTNTPV